MTTHSKSNALRRGFTIVELVIVIAVLGILVAIMVPTFSGIADTARQNALRMDLGNAYTSFKADCGFRDEVCLEMEAYIFVHKDAVKLEGGTFNVANITFAGDGYQWNGNVKSRVDTVTADRLSTLYDAKAVLFGPFNNYLLMALNQAFQWEGSGTEADPYLVKSYRDLRSIGEHTARGESFGGKHFLLTTDLSITNDSWLPIGGYLSPSQNNGLSPVDFSGTFDGGGHTITLSYGQVDRASYCLFGSATDATICNLKTAGNIDLLNIYAAGIAARAEYTTFYNCENAATIGGDFLVGGIVAYAFHCDIYNCVNTGAITSYEMFGDSQIGGIAGEAGYSTIENCRNEGIIMCYAGAVGGIAGNAYGTIRNCVNEGSVTARYFADPRDIGTGSNDALAGGIVGYGGQAPLLPEDTVSSFVNIDGCLNTGNVTGAGRSVGGIIGANARSITNCANTGAVTGKGYVGGIIGVVNDPASTIANVMNSGLITSRGEEDFGSYFGPVGGIVGHLAFNDSWTLTLAVSGGEVHYRKDAPITAYDDLGMFVGSAGGTVTLKNAYLSISAGATIGTKTGITQNMGKGITVSGTPSTQTNQSTLASSLNSVISGNYAGKSYRNWSVKAGYADGKALPTVTHSIIFEMNNTLPANRQVGFSINTAFVGAETIYLPFPDRNVVVYDGWQYTFKHWYVNEGFHDAGTQITLTGDTAATAVWERQPYTMTPIPFA